MPHTRTAKKRLRQSKSRNDHNRELKKSIKIQVKKFFRALKDGDPEEIQKEHSLVAKRLDKCAARRIIHPNKVARRKSQLARLLNAKQAKPGDEGS